MKNKSVIKKDEKSMTSGVAIGVLLSVMSSLLLAVGTAGLITNEKLSEGGIHYFALLITLISGMVGGLVAGKIVGSKYAVVTGLTGLVYLLVLIAVGILFFDGGFNMLWTSTAAIAVGAAASCVLCITGTRGRGKRKRVTR